MLTGSETESLCPLPLAVEAELGAVVRTSFSGPILMIVCYWQSVTGIPQSATLAEA